MELKFYFKDESVVQPRFAVVVSNDGKIISSTTNQDRAGKFSNYVLDTVASYYQKLNREIVIL